MSVLAKQISLPLAFSSLITGRRSLPPAPRCFGSMTTVLERPVTSSTWLWTVMPSMKSWKRMKPATSVTTGWVCGSQVAMTWPDCTESPSFTVITAP